MATKQKRERVRYGLQINFGSEEERLAFHRRLDSVRKRLSPGSAELDNLGLLGAMMDSVEGVSPRQPSASPGTTASSSTASSKTATVAAQSFLRNCGK